MGGPVANPPAEEKAFEFPQGLFGFPGAKRFVITDIPGGGDVFKQMVALDQENLSFTIIDPFPFFPEYAPEIPDNEVQGLGAEQPEQVVVMAIANVPAQFRETTANLKAPLVFNLHTRKARQVILADERFTTRHRLFQSQ